MDRFRIVPVAVTAAEPTVAVLDPQFGVIVLGDLDAAFGRFGLRVEDPIGPFAVVCFHSPLISMKDYKYRHVTALLSFEANYSTSIVIYTLRK